MTNSKALLFGINYKTSSCPLNGCINDVHNMTDYLKSKNITNIECYTDESNYNDVTGYGIMRHLSKLALETWSQNLDFVWIHYSGHGCQMKDNNGDEVDGYDECICPVDYDKTGVIPDDYIRYYLNNMNPKTRVVCVFDCCHSGSIADLPYIYKSKSERTLENKAACQSKILVISGCMDTQTSADAYGVSGRLEFTGALTSCLLEAIKKSTNDVFDILEHTRNILKSKRFAQYPQISSSYDLTADSVFIKPF